MADLTDTDEDVNVMTVGKVKIDQLEYERVNDETSGDDALAMSISRLTGLDIQWVYLISDLSVLALSLSYIPLKRLVYSLLTVVLSGQIIGLIQKIPLRRKNSDAP